MKLLNFKENLKRIERLNALQNIKNCSPKIISVDGWVASDDESVCFADYLDKVLKNISENATVILDDLQIGSNNLYLPYTPLFELDKQAIKPFLECFDNAKWLSMYIEVVSAKERYFADTIDDTAFQDFLQHYKTMGIEEMVVRYSDHQKWFTGNKYN